MEAGLPVPQRAPGAIFHMAHVAHVVHGEPAATLQAAMCLRPQ